MEASSEKRQMEGTTWPSPPFTHVVGTALHEKGSPEKFPLLHLASPETPTWQGALPWSSGTVLSGLTLSCPSSADTFLWVPRPLLLPGHRADGKEGVKACKCESL